jgi:hypothetical protein
MNLTKENALKAASGALPSPSTTTNTNSNSVARTPTLARPTPTEEEKAYVRKEKGQSTRLDGRPDRRKSVLGRAFGGFRRLRCTVRWEKAEDNEKS